MKRFALAGMACLIFAVFACNNEADTSPSSDSLNNRPTQDNTENMDTSMNRGDTSSYERMPGQVNDSMPR